MHIMLPHARAGRRAHSGPRRLLARGMKRTVPYNTTKADLPESSESGDGNESSEEEEDEEDEDEEQAEPTQQGNRSSTSRTIATQSPPAATASARASQSVMAAGPPPVLAKLENNSLASCSNVTLSWIGGEAPYKMMAQISDAGRTDNTSRVLAQEIRSNSVVWTVDVAPRHNLTFQLQDAKGRNSAVSSAASIVHGQTPDLSCLGIQQALVQNTSMTSEVPQPSSLQSNSEAALQKSNHHAHVQIGILSAFLALGFVGIVVLVLFMRRTRKKCQKLERDMSILSNMGSDFEKVEPVKAYEQSFSVLSRSSTPATDADAKSISSLEVRSVMGAVDSVDRPYSQYARVPSRASANGASRFKLLMPTIPNLPRFGKLRSQFDTPTATSAHPTSMVPSARPISESSFGGNRFSKVTIPETATTAVTGVTTSHYNSKKAATISPRL